MPARQTCVAVTKGKQRAFSDAASTTLSASSAGGSHQAGEGSELTVVQSQPAGSAGSPRATANRMVVGGSAARPTARATGTKGKKAARHAPASSSDVEMLDFADDDDDDGDFEQDAEAASDDEVDEEELEAEPSSTSDYESPKRRPSAKARGKQGFGRGRGASAPSRTFASRIAATSLARTAVINSAHATASAPAPVRTPLEPWHQGDIIRSVPADITRFAERPFEIQGGRYVREGEQQGTTVKVETPWAVVPVVDPTATPSLAPKNPRAKRVKSESSDAKSPKTPAKPREPRGSRSKAASALAEKPVETPAPTARKGKDRERPSPPSEEKRRMTKRGKASHEDDGNTEQSDVPVIDITEPDIEQPTAAQASSENAHTSAPIAIASVQNTAPATIPTPTATTSHQTNAQPTTAVPGVVSVEQITRQQAVNLRATILSELRAITASMGDANDEITRLAIRAGVDEAFETLLAMRYMELDILISEEQRAHLRLRQVDLRLRMLARAQRAQRHHGGGGSDDNDGDSGIDRPQPPTGPVHNQQSAGKRGVSENGNDPPTAPSPSSPAQSAQDQRSAYIQDAEETDQVMFEQQLEYYRNQEQTSAGYQNDEAGPSRAPRGDKWSGQEIQD